MITNDTSDQVVKGYVRDSKIKEFILVQPWEGLKSCSEGDVVLLPNGCYYALTEHGSWNEFKFHSGGPSVLIV
jgi:hypothetical protein